MSTHVAAEINTQPATWTRAVRLAAEVGHSAGTSLEAEPGEIGGKDGVHAPGVRTDPSQAASFVSEINVDALASR